MLRGDLGIMREYYFLNVDNAISYFLEPDTTQAWIEYTSGEVRLPNPMPRNLYLALQKRYWKMNNERDYTLVSPTNESEGGWMTVELGGESGYYGEFEVLPSIYFLLRGGYLDRNLLGELDGLEDENSEIFNEVLDRIIGEDSSNSTDLWEVFLLPGLANYFRDSNTEYGIMYNFNRQVSPTNPGRISGRLSPWNGPKWEDEVVE